MNEVRIPVDATTSAACRIESQILPQRGVVLISARGLLHGPEAFAAVRAVYAHPRFSDALNLVWDLTHCRIDASLGSLGELAQGSPRAANEADEARGQGGRTAWVVGNVADQWLLESLYQEFSWPARWKYFNELSEALDWAACPATAAVASRGGVS